MKEKISRTSLVVYAVLLVLSCFFPSAAGDAVVWYCIIGIFAIPPIVAGSLRYKIPGLIALLIAIALAGSDYHTGKRIHDRWEENARRREGLTNSAEEVVSMEAHKRLLERINRNGDINYDIVPRPLVTLEEFFEGNKDYGSIGYNFYPDQPNVLSRTTSSLVLLKAAIPESIMRYPRGCKQSVFGGIERRSFSFVQNNGLGPRFRGDDKQ